MFSLYLRLDRSTVRALYDFESIDQAIQTVSAHCGVCGLLFGKDPTGRITRVYRSLPDKLQDRYGELAIAEICRDCREEWEFSYAA